MKQRLDQALVALGLVATRSQGESYIKLGHIKVNGRVVNKPGNLVDETDLVTISSVEQYVSRAALKLASVASALKLDFNNKTVLDVGSSTGGFTDYALKHGAKKVIAVEVGTEQLHPSLRGNPQIELHEKTDIRDVRIKNDERRTTNESQLQNSSFVVLDSSPDIVVADVSFISLRLILPSVAKLCTKNTQIAVMVKPQFEAAQSNLKHKGVIKNDSMRRDILKDFEAWTHGGFVIIYKADSEIAGAKGNKERFYLLKRV